MSVEIWRLPRVLKATGMGRSWTYEAIARREFPAPVKLGSRAVGWRRSDIEAWLESREARAA
ncbi:AlpA family phage regulatory protein [Maritalea mobilis]|uniref:helix-turn-helix transcriptional regulator n=1 Tax=Maritalea mobilis TaxID=483324 RepID=UPI001C939686|nr:AlpA family phage regulatory protein [Maritalea mobilis]